MGDEFISFLERSSPPVSESPEVRRALSELVASIDRVDRAARKRRSAGFAAAIAVAALVLGGSTTAFASPAVQDWLGFHPSVTFPWTATVDNRPKHCQMGVEVVAAVDPHTLAAARRYVSELDFSTIQSSAAYRRAYAAQQQLPNSTARAKQFVALSQVVNRMIGARLASEHLNSAGLLLRQATNCIDETR